MGIVTPVSGPIGLAIIAGQLGLGGAERQLYQLLNGLDRSRFRPLVINLGPRSDEYWEDGIKALDVPVWGVPRILGRAARALKIASYLREMRARIVHGWVLHTNPYSAVAGRLAGVPLRMGSLRGSYEDMPRNKLIRWMGYHGIDVLVTNSAAAARQVQELQPRSPGVRVIPNGVQIPPQVTHAERKRLKVELGFSSSDSLIGSIGRLDANKNYGMLLRVFAGLADNWPSLRLVIFGDGPLKSQLAAAAKQLGMASKVCFPGEMPSATQYLPALDVCCLTSYTEGMPNIVMEASAAGLPVVATISGGCSELIEQGVTGFLVAPDDDAGMKEKLEVLLMDPATGRRMGRAGRQKMCREFTITVMVSRMTQLYEEALAAKGTGVINRILNNRQLMQ